MRCVSKARGEVPPELRGVGGRLSGQAKHQAWQREAAGSVRRHLRGCCREGGGPMPAAAPPRGRVGVPRGTRAGPGSSLVMSHVQSTPVTFLISL